MNSTAELAATFDKDVVERYGRHFVVPLEEQLRDLCTGLTKPLRALDLACGTGFAARQLIRVLPENSQLVALSNSRDLLDIFHQFLQSQPQEGIFVRKHDPTRLPFAAQSFAVAWLCAPTSPPQDLRPALRQAMRVLQPGGLLLLSVPLRGSFQELTHAVASLDDTQGDKLTLQQVLRDRLELLDTPEVEQLLARAGAYRVSSVASVFTTRANAPLSRDRLFARHLSPLWLTPKIDTLEATRLLDRVIDQSLEVSVRVGCFIAQKNEA